MTQGGFKNQFTRAFFLYKLKQRMMGRFHERCVKKRDFKAKLNVCLTHSQLYGLTQGDYKQIQDGCLSHRGN